MSILGKNIRALRLQQKQTLEELALVANLDPGNLSRIERGQGGYSRESLERIAKALGVSLGTLFAEGGDDALPLMGTRRVPVLEGKDALEWIGRTEKTTGQRPRGEHVLAEMQSSGDSFAMRVPDDSMLPEFRKQDMIIFDPSTQPVPGDFVVAYGETGGMIFRQYRVRELGQSGEPVFDLAPMNPVYPIYRSDTTDLKVVGTMIEHRRYRSAK